VSEAMPHGEAGRMVTHLNCAIFSPSQIPFAPRVDRSHYYSEFVLGIKPILYSISF
jgi:hypothetical protein